MQDATGAVVAFDHVTKRYGGTGAPAAVDDLSLTIPAGEICVLVGPSGSGKTTFLMILAGFLPPSDGRLFSDGVDITYRPAELRAAGMVFQGYALFPHMSVEANVAFPLKVRKRPASEVRQRVAEMIARVGLKGHPVGSLLIYDEPNLVFGAVGPGDNSEVLVTDDHREVGE